MPQLSFNRIYFLVLSVFCLISVFSTSQPVNAGIIQVPVTDVAHDRLIGYWDLRDRDSYFQVTNTSGVDVSIHIQLFNVTTGCAEFDYFDTLTPRDTHLYDVSELDRNNGAALASPDLSGGHGILAISVSPQTSGLQQLLDNVLEGNFRIVDDSGYEYRTNLSGESRLGGNIQQYLVNFNNTDGSVFSDLVVIAYSTNGDSDTITPQTGEYFVELFDADENPISCPPIVLGCLPDESGLGNVINVGINQAVTNSRGGPSLCLGTDTTGYINLFPESSLDRSAIFIGLNNGNGTGSIDSVVSTFPPL